MSRLCDKSDSEKVDADFDNDDNDKATPLVPSAMNRKTRWPTGTPAVAVNDLASCVDDWIRKYELWTYERPLLSKCATSSITGLIGALLASATRKNRQPTRKTNQQQQHGRRIDWLEVIAFAIHGGLVAGPLSYYIDSFVAQRKQRRQQHSWVAPNNESSSSSYYLLIDQVVAAPPKLYLTFVVVDLMKQILRTGLPEASRKSIALLASAVSDSLRFWPLSMYLLLKLLKRRRQYATAINLCSIAFSMHLAKKRNAIEK